jgi:hypothetical protein
MGRVFLISCFVIAFGLAMAECMFLGSMMSGAYNPALHDRVSIDQLDAYFIRLKIQAFVLVGVASALGASLWLTRRQFP